MEYTTDTVIKSLPLQNQLAIRSIVDAVNGASKELLIDLAVESMTCYVSKSNILVWLDKHKTLDGFDWELTVMQKLNLEIFKRQLLNDEVTKDDIGHGLVQTYLDLLDIDGMIKSVILTC